MEYIINIHKLNKTFGKTPAVKDLDLAVIRGEMFAFLGPNGAGKSTTLRMICGLCRPGSGSVVVDGVELTAQKNEYKKKIGLVCQHFNVDTELTVYENLKIHAYLYKMNKNNLEKKIHEMLSAADLSDKKHALASALSGGMKRKLQIVRAIMHSPEILFLDEPTAGLDAFSREKIWNLIKKLNSKGTTVFFTTHYIEEAQNYAMRVAIIHHGQIIKLSEPGQMITELGKWCRETFHENTTKRKYFTSREKAEQYNKDIYKKLIIRPTQLEDVFISLTGEKEL